MLKRIDTKHRATDSHPRAGLAPLELTLYLPIMLFVMALIVIFGTAGAWKVRTLQNARHAAWRDFRGRTGADDPHPKDWPANAEMERQSGQPPVIEQDPYRDHQVVRGPILADPGSGEFLLVHQGTMDFQKGLYHGHARIERGYPMLGDMPPGKIDFTRHHVVLDGTRFQYLTMGLPSNDSRRVPVIYDFLLERRVPQLTQAYVEAAIAVVYNQQRLQLLPLEGPDPEVYSLLGWFSPDFQPKIDVRFRRVRLPEIGTRVPTYATLFPDKIRQEKLDGRGRLKWRISHVPHRMTSYYLNVYRTKKAQLEAQLQAAQQSGMPAPPGIAGQIAELERKIKQLEEFQGTLSQN